MSFQDYGIPAYRVGTWMNAIRTAKSEEERYSLLECFWESQLKSKIWLIEEVKNILNIENKTLTGSAYVFGGWHGLNAMFLRDNFPNISTVYSIDENPICVMQGQLLTNYDTRISFITEKMENFKFYPEDVSLIVNTATEHISQETFDTWFKNVPKNVLVILQGNNFTELKSEHIRTTKTLKEFIKLNKIKKSIYTGQLDCIQFTRFMNIGYKT
jgi:hypothetical protein